jgi:hypothetical protein
METMVESKSSGFGSNDLQADAELSLSEFTTFLQEFETSQRGAPKPTGKWTTATGINSTARSWRA